MAALDEEDNTRLFQRHSFPMSLNGFDNNLLCDSAFLIFVTNPVGMSRRNDDLEAVFMKKLIVTEPSSLARHIIGIGTPESSEMSPMMLELIQST